jgi:uracil-DNA glycosylase family 4
VKLADLNWQIIACRKCPRLVAWREAVAAEKRRAYRDWDYWGKPVPGFGDAHASVLVVGLAPGAHGSNRTGRQFTGDASGDFLYPALHRAGYASQPISSSRDDDLKLNGLYLTAAARCAPPANRPTPQELANCQPYLEREIELIKPSVIVCLGRVAFERILRIFSFRPSMFEFRNGAHYRLEKGKASPPAGRDNAALPDALWLVCSYHPSQQNTLTGKLTRRMFAQVWKKTRELSDHD